MLIDKTSSNSMLDVKSSRGENSDSDHFLVTGKYGYKIALRKHEIFRNHKNLI
jgi:hypothetical protein